MICHSNFMTGSGPLFPCRRWQGGMSFVLPVGSRRPNRSPVATTALQREEAALHGYDRNSDFSHALLRGVASFGAAVATGGMFVQRPVQFPEGLTDAHSFDDRRVMPRAFHTLAPVAEFAVGLVAAQAHVEFINRSKGQPRSRNRERNEAVGRARKCPVR
jgi:hypothetical protein